MKVVAIDCEMVASGTRSLLAKVSIVDHDGTVLLDEYVRPTDVVTDYRKNITGFTREHLDRGKSLSQVQSEVSNLLRGKVLVGHSLQIDLDALNLSHPEGDQKDVAKYGPFMNNNKKQAQSLKLLAQKHLNKCIQDGVHDSVEDARTAMELYKLVANNWN